MKKLLRINQRTYLFDEDTDEQITLLDGDHLILLIKVIKMNNEEIKKIRKESSK